MFGALFRHYLYDLMLAYNLIFE